MSELKPESAIDLILAPTLVGLAWAVLMSKDHFRSVVLFIVLGLLMALVWVRLGAPDIALAEAAIGTGMTAALLLEAARQIEISKPDSTGITPEDQTSHESDIS